MRLAKANGSYIYSVELWFNIWVCDRG